MDYAAPAWSPWTSVTNIQRLERVQYAVARSITSQLRSTPLEALTREANFPTLASRYRMLATIQADRWNNLEDEDAREKLLLTNVQQRLKRSDWRSKAPPAMETLGLLHASAQPITSQAKPPWNLPPPILTHQTQIAKHEPPKYKGSRPQDDQRPGPGGPPLHQ